MFGKISVKYLSLLVTIGLLVLMYGFGSFMYTGFLSPQVFLNLWDRLETSQKDVPDRANAMVAVGVDEDTGYEWWGLRPPRGEDFVIPVGRTINLHSQAFSEELRQAYGRILPDVFASDTGESIFTFMTAAINRRFLLMGKPTVRHEHSMDGASVGFRGKPLTFKIEMDEFRRRIFEEGKQLGFGYEECQSIAPHDPSKYDADGNCTEPELKDWIRRNMFLRPEEFSYDSVKHTFEE